MLSHDEVVRHRTTAVLQYRRRLLLEALANWLVSTQGYVVAGVTETGAEILRLCAQSRPNVVMLEVEPAGPDTQPTLDRLRDGAGGPFLVGLYDTVDTAPLRLHHFQVHRLVSLHAGLSALQAALRDAAPSAAAESVSLTARELEVLTMICAGCSAVQVGHALGISVHTVVNHKRRIFSKLGVQSRAQAAAEVTRLGLVDWDSFRAASLLAVAYPRTRPIALTRRERDILGSIACGHSVRQTAQALGIAIKTVQSEQRQLFSRLGATNRAEALILARGFGLIEDIGQEAARLDRGQPS